MKWGVEIFHFKSCSSQIMCISSKFLCKSNEMIKFNEKTTTYNL